MKILIVDDDKMLCSSLKHILSTEGLDIVGLAHNGDDALKFCQNNQVDVILMDIRMPICDGVLGTKKIKQQFPRVKIIILTTFDDDIYITEALKNGASAYLLKTINPTKMIKTIKLIYEGEMVLGSEIASKITDLIENQPYIDTDKFNLSKTDIEIIELIANGYNNKEISNLVYMSEGTIRNKISDILNKLKLRDRTQIAIFWHTNGNFIFKT